MNTVDTILNKLEELKTELKASEQRTQENIEKSHKELKDTLEEHDRRIKAKESFPTPPYNTLLQQPNVITQGSVSNPKWGKRSIFG